TQLRPRGCDGHHLRDVLAGNDDVPAAAVEVGLTHRAGTGRAEADVRPVELAGDRHSLRAVLAGDDGVRAAAVEISRGDRALVNVTPVELIGADRHPALELWRKHAGDDGVRAAAVEAGRPDRTRPG